MDNKARAGAVLKRLRKAYPSPVCALHFKTPFQLLLATILSAQSTDVQVNKLTPALFDKYPDSKSIARAPLPAIEKAVSSVNFYRNKAKHIKRSAEIIEKDFGGLVPRTMPELITLPGVARKTANIVLSTGYGIIEGIAVDTHVMRLSGMLKLTKHTDPVKIEQDLMALVPRKRWADFSHLLILHGRAVCNARRPMHDECVLRDICPSAGLKP